METFIKRTQDLSWGQGALGDTQHCDCLLGSRAVRGMQLGGCKGCQLLLQRMAGVWSSIIFCCSPPVCQNYCTWDCFQALLCPNDPVYLNALNCHFFLTLDYFHRAVSAAGRGEAVSGRCWVDGENVPRTFGEASWPAALTGAVGAVLGAAAFPHMPVLQAVQSQRDASPGPLTGRGTLITVTTLHPCGQKFGEMWVISDFTRILRDPELWHWDLDEADEFWKRKEKFQCTLRIAKNEVLLPDEVAHAFSSLLFLLLFFSPAFHFLLPCLSVLLLQLLRDPAAHPVFSRHISHWSVPASSCVLRCYQQGASDRGPWPCSWTQEPPSITCCCWLLVLGTSISVILTVPGAVRAQTTGQAHCLCSVAAFPISCHPKALHRGCACAQQVRKCLLCLWWKVFVV